MKILTAGQRLSVNNDLKSETFRIALNWQCPKGYEPEVSVFLLSEKGKLEKKENLIYLQNTASPCSGIIVQPGDSGFRKFINVNLARVFSETDKIIFMVSVRGGPTGKNLKDLRQFSVKITDPADNKLLTEYKPDISDEISFCFMEIYRSNGGWRIKAANTGYTSGLNQVIDGLFDDIHEEQNDSLLRITCDHCSQINTFTKNTSHLYCAFCFKELISGIPRKEPPPVPPPSPPINREKFTFTELLVVSGILFVLCSGMIFVSELARLISEYLSFLCYTVSFTAMSVLMYGFASEKKYASYVFETRDIRGYFAVCTVGLFFSLFMFSMLCREIYLLDNSLFIAPSKLQPVHWLAFGFDNFLEAVFLDIPAIYDLHISEIRPRAVNTMTWVMIYKLTVDFVLLKAIIKYSNLKFTFLTNFIRRTRSNITPKIRLKEEITFIFLVIGSIAATFLFGLLCMTTGNNFPDTFTIIASKNTVSEWIRFGFYNLFEVIFFDAPDVYQIKMSAVNPVSFTAKTMMLLFRTVLDIFFVSSIIRLWIVLEINNKIVSYVNSRPEHKKVEILGNIVILSILFAVMLLFTLFAI